MGKRKANLSFLQVEWRATVCPSAFHRHPFFSVRYLLIATDQARSKQWPKQKEQNKHCRSASLSPTLYGRLARTHHDKGLLPGRVAAGQHPATRKAFKLSARSPRAELKQQCAAVSRSRIYFKTNDKQSKNRLETQRSLDISLFYLD